MSSITQDRKPINSEEWNELMALFFDRRNFFSKEILLAAQDIHPLNFNPPPNISYSAMADFLFRCETCTIINHPTQWYKIILDTIGGSPYFRQHTDEDELRIGNNDSNLSKILKDDKTDYQTSGLNFIEGTGYVCDHCKETVFEEGF
jgi:hypothetical protein